MNGIATLEPLLEPQERLDRLINTTARRFGRKVVDLSYANPHDRPDQTVIRALERAIHDDRALAFQYTPYGGRTITRRLVASHLGLEYGLPFTFRDIIMTPGAMAALNVVLRTLFRSDDELIVLTPCWQDYPLYLRNLGIRARHVGLAEDKHLDLVAIQDAVNSTTRGILFSQPCCPTGVLYSRNDIEELARLLRDAEARFGTRIYLISDEVHRRLLWSGASFHSPLLSYPRSLSVYSFGKALALQGQRIGYVAVSPRMPERDDLRGALERGVRLMGFCAPTSLMQRAICDLLDYQPPLDTLAKRQDEVRSQLTAYGYEVCKAEATFFVYAKAPISDDFKFAEAVASFGVLIVPSALFHESGYFRLSLTARSDSISAGLPAFARVLQSL